VGGALGVAGRMLGAFALSLASGLVLSGGAYAGNGANFVLYNHHMAKQGETEINLYSDTSNIGSNEEDYTAQLLEFELGVTSYWTSALYLEGDHIEGEEYEFGGWRFENRLRLFENATILNPVLYAEYEEARAAHRYILGVTGRTDAIEEEEEGEMDEREEAEEETERVLETRLILGHDFSDRFNVAFNWINEANVESGKWEFGYAAGLNYVFYEASEARKSPNFAPPSGWELEKLTLGLELYGGLGDSELGLTIDPGRTEQYLGVNVQGELDNHLHVGIGGAFGLTGDSENAILRLTAGYEFE
jgi:hypothetical protein